MTDLNEQGALDLLDQVSKETDLVKQLEMRKALDAYQTKRNDSGLPAFSTPEDQRIENRKRHEAFYAAGLSGIDKVLPEGDREIFNQTIANSVDPENTKAEAVNKLYVGQNRPELVPLMKDNWEGVKSGFAKSQFGWGGGPISDTAFYSMAAGKFKEQADERTMISNVFADIQLAAAKGDSFLETWKKSSNAAMANPSWKIEKHDKYRELAQNIYDETVTKTGPLRPAIELGKAYYGKAAAGEFDKSAYDAFVEELVGLEPDQRKLALSLAISVGVDKAPRERDAGGSAGFMETAAVRMERAAGAFPRGILRLVAQEEATYAKGEPGADLAKLDEQKTRLDVMRKVDEGLTGAVDPATSSNAFVKGIYDAIDSGPYMLAAMSVYGLPLVMASMAEDNRAQLMERGVPAKEAESLAWIAAAPQTIIERLQATMLLGKIPGFEKWLSKTVTTKTGFVTKMLGVTGIEIAQQNTEELLQAFMPPLVQEVASWFSDVYPDVKWTGTGGELDQIATGTVDTFFAMLPLVLIGTGSASFKEASYGLKYLQDIKVLRAGGFTERAAAEIADLASAGDLAGAAQLANEGWTDPNKRPRSKLEALNAEVAARVGEMDQANLEADAAAMEDLDADLKASYEESVNPVGATAVKLEDGTWQVSDEQGNLVDITTSPEAAQELVKIVDQAADLNTEESLNDLVDYFDARAEEGSTIELLGTRKSLADKVALGEITAEEAAHSVQIAIQFGQLEEGTQTTGAYLGGENEAKFNAKEQIFKDVSRVFYDGDTMTLVEEKAEGYLKRRLQDGTLDLAEIDAWREKVDGPQADKSARALTEWFSKWAQGYIVGNQDNALIPSSFRAFLLKMKKYMDEILGFAARYAELDAAGKLDDGFKMHLARAVGLDQNWVARQARTEAKANEGVTFSLTQTNTPAFKKLFGDSKVVDKNGNPLAVYHGTPHGGFKIFRGMNWFSTSPEIANSFAVKTHPDDTPAVYKAYLSIKNPFVTDDGYIARSKLGAKEIKDKGYDGIHFIPKDGMMTEFWVTFDSNQIKSATGNNGEWDGNNPDITFSLTNIKKTSANDLADKQGVPRTIPQKYKGKKILPIMADLLGAGTADGIPIEGGPAHPILYAGTGVAWRSNRGAIAGILGMLKSRGAIWVDENGKRKALVSVFAMSQDAHQSNKNTFLSFIKVIEDSSVSDAAKIRLGKYVRDKAKNKAFASDRLAKFPLSWDTAKLDAYAADFTFAERSSLMTMLRQAGAQEIGTPDAETIVRQLRDDSYDKVSSGSMLNIIEVDVDRLEQGLKDDTLNASDFGVPEHVSYDTILPGDIVTHLRQPVAMEVAFKGMVKQMSEASPKSRPDYLMQAKLPASVQLETLTDERIAEINAEQSGQTSVAKAKAYIAALSDRWNTVNAKSTKGVADFISAIKRNLFSETLTKMDRSEVTKMAKEGKMEVFGLEGFDVWFGLITKEDGTKELVSVVSNEHSTGGMLDLVMMKSIDEGATRLDCYAVKNSKMPNGLLPTLYGKHGWRVTETLPYNKKYLGDTDAARDKKEKALMTQWESQGWDRTLHGMPDVVVMEHDQALSNARKSQGDAFRRMAEGTLGKVGAESAESTAGDVNDGRSRSDGGQPSRDAGRGGERYSRKVRDFIAELETATGNRLKAWGITPEQRDQIVDSARSSGASDSTFALTSDRRSREVKQVMRERRVSQRINTGEHAGDLFDSRLRERMEKNMYQAQSLPETVNEAMKIIKKKTSAEILLLVQDDSASLPRAVQVALAAASIEHFNDIGDMESAFIAAERAAELGTELGRAVNAFKLLGKVLDTPGKAQAFFARQAARVKKSLREKEPARDAAKQVISDVRKDALKLLEGWLADIYRTKRASNPVAIKVELFPEVTFSLSSAIKQSGLVEVVAQMLEESNPADISAALRAKYGEKVEKHIPDLFVAGVKLNNKKASQNVKKAEDAVAKADKKAAKADQTSKPAKVAPVAPKESESGLPMDLADKATNEVLKRMKVRNLDTPEQVRDVIKSLFEKNGLNVTPEMIDLTFAEKFKIPRLDEEGLKRLSDLAKNIASTPEDSAERTDATIALTDFVNVSLGEIDFLDKAWAVWYANILSGYNTHLRNMYANTWSLITELPSAALSFNPARALFNLKAIFAGGASGVKLGSAEFFEQLRTGKTSILRSNENKFRGQDTLERAPFAGGKINPFNWLVVVKRALTAEDLFGFATAQEVKARMVAWEMAKSSGLEGDALNNEIEKILNNTDEQQADFALRADGEWDRLTPELQKGKNKEKWVSRRVSELRVMERDGQLIERASDFAARATFNYKPDGFVGIIANALMNFMGAAGSMKVDSNTDRWLKAIATSPKLVIPFIRIGANVLNRGIDYSGVGFLVGRGLLKKKLVTKGSKVGTEAKTVDELHMERARGIMGIAVMGIIGALSDPEDDEAMFQVHGRGAGNKEKNNALNGPNFMPYSIEYRRKDGSSRFISFQYTPFAMGLAALGQYNDSVRYKRFGPEERSARLAAALLGIGQVLLDASFLSNAADFLQLWAGGTESTEKALYRFFGRTFNPANIIPFTNLIRQIDSDFDPVKRDRGSIKASLMGNMPVVQRANKPAIDILGDVIENRGFDWFTRSETAGTPEARIYKAFGDKNVSPSNTYTYKGRMEPDQFYDFVKIRGEQIKDILLANDMEYLKYLEGLNDEEAKKMMGRVSTVANDEAKAQVGFDPELQIQPPYVSKQVKE
jgi:hypothetical protein